jgi:hypothetical protein
VKNVNKPVLYRPLLRTNYNLYPPSTIYISQPIGHILEDSFGTAKNSLGRTDWKKKIYEGKNVRLSIFDHAVHNKEKRPLH